DVADLDRLGGAALQDERCRPARPAVGGFDDFDPQLGGVAHVAVHETGVGHVEGVGEPVAGEPLLVQEVVGGGGGDHGSGPAQVDSRERPYIHRERRIGGVGKVDA